MSYAEVSQKIFHIHRELALGNEKQQKDMEI